MHDTQQLPTIKDPWTGDPITDPWTGDPITEPWTGDPITLLRAHLNATRALLADLPTQVWRIPSPELGTLIEDITALRAAGETATLALGFDAVQRGVITESQAANPTAWLAIHTVPIPEAATLAKAITICATPTNTMLRDSAYAGRVSARGVVTAARETDKLATCLPASITRDELLGHFLTIADTGGPHDMRRLAQRLLATYGGDQYERDVTKQHDVETLTWRHEPTGMWSITAVLAPDHAAQLKAAITALSAPQPPTPGDTHPSTLGDTLGDCLNGTANNTLSNNLTSTRDGARDGLLNGTHRPTTTPGPTTPGTTAPGATTSGTPTSGPTIPPTRDTRTAGKRRLDALMTLITRAMSTDPTTTPPGPATQMIVTLPYTLLRDGLPGYATTTTNTDLDPGTARRLACDADLIPAVLNTPSAPLDIGRTKRLATTAQRHALTLRDHGCTFPGCDRPPGWCIAHHITHWIHGGPTTMDNLTLLCERHHTIVHRDHLTATITPTGVHWHPPHNTPPTP